MIKTPDWVKQAVFYQIFPDRFRRVAQPGDEYLNLEDWDSLPTTYGFKGGNLYGVTEKLVYLADLGISAIYFNPIFSSPANHRYHTYDYYNVDPLLGGNKAFRLLLDEAHKRDIRIVLDGVFNHASRGFWQFNHTLENKAASPYVDWFHFDEDRLSGEVPWSAYKDVSWDDITLGGERSMKAYGFKAWWDLPALPKFNTDFPAVRDFIFDVAEYWIKFGIDGWRLDVPEEIDDPDFWREFRIRVKDLNPEAYIVGEIWHEAKRWLQGDQFDAVMNYPITLASLGFFANSRINFDQHNPVGDYHHQVDLLNGEEFSAKIDEIFGWYDEGINQAQLNLLESHDTPRLVTYAGGDKNTQKLAALLMFTIPGAPTIYYGSEVGLAGRKDPDCRRAFPWDENLWDRELLDYYKSLIMMRSQQPALRTGSFKSVHADEVSYAYERVLEGERIIVVFNAAEQIHTIDLPGLAGDLIFGQAEITESPGNFEVKIGARQGLVIKA